jgi:hypothetical protein
MKIHKNWCSYIPALSKALEEVNGDVLELGAGIHSTFYLHWMCLHQGRSLITYESDKQFYEMVKHCDGDRHENDFHKIFLVDDWDDIDIEKSWGIVLIDHGPGIRRIKEIAILGSYAQCLVIHDAQGRHDSKYRYSEIYPLFLYKQLYGSFQSQTIILSNFVDVTQWE